MIIARERYRNMKVTFGEDFLKVLGDSLLEGGERYLAEFAEYLKLFGACHNARRHLAKIIVPLAKDISVFPKYSRILPYASMNEVEHLELVALYASSGASIIDFVSRFGPSSLNIVLRKHGDYILNVVSSDDKSFLQHHYEVFKMMHRRHSEAYLTFIQQRRNRLTVAELALVACSLRHVMMPQYKQLILGLLADIACASQKYVMNEPLKEFFSKKVNSIAMDLLNELNLSSDEFVAVNVLVGEEIFEIVSGAGRMKYMRMLIDSALVTQKQFLGEALSSSSFWSCFFFDGIEKLASGIQINDPEQLENLPIKKSAKLNLYFLWMVRHTNIFDDFNPEMGKKKVKDFFAQLKALKSFPEFYQNVRDDKVQISDEFKQLVLGSEGSLQKMIDENWQKVKGELQIALALFSENLAIAFKCLADALNKRDKMQIKVLAHHILKSDPCHTFVVISQIRRSHLDDNLKDSLVDQLVNAHPVDYGKLFAIAQGSRSVGKFDGFVPHAEELHSLLLPNRGNLILELVLHYDHPEVQRYMPYFGTWTPFRIFKFFLQLE